jgi:hypothetical protein
MFLTANILQTMRRGGNVLVSVDTAGRVLELAQLLVSTVYFFSVISLHDALWIQQVDSGCQNNFFAQKCYLEGE